MRRDPICCKVCKVELSGGLDTFGVVGAERCFECYFGVESNELVEAFDSIGYLEMTYDEALENAHDAKVYASLFDDVNDPERISWRKAACAELLEARRMLRTLNMAGQTIEQARYWHNWWRETIARTEAERVKRLAFDLDKPEV